jgi:hypothetical protein
MHTWPAPLSRHFHPAVGFIGGVLQSLKLVNCSGDDVAIGGAHGAFSQTWTEEHPCNLS